MRNLMLFLLFSSLTLIPLTSAMPAGIQIGRTRVIYDSAKKEVALPVMNKESDLPWLIQSWVDTGDGKTHGPFFVTPPLFRLDANKEQSLRIIWSGASLPEDKESLFYINIRTIPAMDKTDNDKNRLHLIYKTRMKLFFRPKNLKGTPEEACSQLHFSRLNNMLQITNASGYHTVFDSLFIGTSLVRDADTLAPASTIQLALPGDAQSNNVSWRCISDYGSATAKFSRSLNG